jgi:hypothetical protein
MKRLVLGLFLFSCSFFCHAQETGCIKVGADGHSELTTNIDFGKYNAFFLGEFHGVYGAPEVKLALIIHLNKVYGVTDVFMEIGRSAAYLYNAYLATGDSSFLEDPTLIYFMKKPFRDFWKNLYHYNKTLERKIVIRGVDFERPEFLKVLRMMMPPSKERPAEIADVLQYIDTVNIPEIARLQGEQTYDQYRIYERVRNSMIGHREIVAQYFGSNFKTVEQVIFNGNTYAGYNKRDSTMYDNIVRAVEQLKIKKWLTINGLNHSDKLAATKRSLAWRLAHDARFANSFVDIAMLCKNCYDAQLRGKPAAPFKGPPSYGRDPALMGRIFGKFFDNKCAYTLLPASATGEDRVKSSYDYIILMKDQPVF